MLLQVDELWMEGGCEHKSIIVEGVDLKARRKIKLAAAISLLTFFVCSRYKVIHSCVHLQQFKVLLNQRPF